MTTTDERPRCGKPLRDYGQRVAEPDGSPRTCWLPPDHPEASRCKSREAVENDAKRRARTGQARPGRYRQLRDVGLGSTDASRHSHSEGAFERGLELAESRRGGGGQ